MDVYRLPPRSITALRRRTLLTATPLAVAAAIAGLVLVQHDQRFSFAVLAVSAFIGFVAVFGSSRALTRAIASWRSYALSVSDDGLVRRQAFVPDLALPRSDISAITAARNGALLIHGASPRHVIIVPPGIERHEELTARLAAWYPIEPPRRLLREPLAGYLASGAALGLMAATMLSNQPAVVLPTALVLTAILLWAFREIRASPNIDQHVKANAKALFFVVAPRFPRGFCPRLA